LNGHVTLGDAKADRVLIKGDITASSATQPDVDFSGAAYQSTPAGTFSVSGALVVSGAAFLNGAVTLGDAKADSVLFKGDVTADSTTAPDIDFKDTPGFFKTSGGAVTMAGPLTVTGAATLNGDVTLGNAKSDSIVVYGDLTADATENPDIDFSGSTGFFRTTSGQSTVLGALTVIGNTILDEDVTLGDAKADAILFKGDMSTSSITNPDMTSALLGTGSGKDELRMKWTSFLAME